jgi:hypothetical protein
MERTPRLRLLGTTADGGFPFTKEEEERTPSPVRQGEIGQEAARLLPIGNGVGGTRK